VDFSFSSIKNYPAIIFTSDVALVVFTANRLLFRALPKHKSLV